jgi:electron transfer flavoprotein alpha/beta subunit
MREIQVKIVVLVKPVYDNTKLRFREGSPVTTGVPLMMNPFDEYALETALKLKEQEASAHVTVMAFASADTREVLKKALAVGADEALLISADNLETLDAAGVAVLLAKAIQTEVPDCQLLLSGCTSLDHASGQTGTRIAELMGFPALSMVKSAVLESGKLILARESEQGVERYRMDLPGAVSVSKCDYELRSANIKGVMKANKASIPVKQCTDYGLDEDILKRQHLKTVVLKTWQHPEKTGGQLLKDLSATQAAEQLLAYLTAEKIV